MALARLIAPFPGRLRTVAGGGASGLPLRGGYLGRGCRFGVGSGVGSGVGFGAAAVGFGVGFLVGLGVGFLVGFGVALAQLLIPPLVADPSIFFGALYLAAGTVPVGGKSAAARRRMRLRSGIWTEPRPSDVPRTSGRLMTLR